MMEMKRSKWLKEASGLEIRTARLWYRSNFALEI